MKKLRHTPRSRIALTLLFLAQLFIHVSVSAQLFVEEGVQRGLNTLITTQGLGGPGVSAIDFDQDGDDDITLGSDGEILFYENIDGNFQLADISLEAPAGNTRGVIWSDINNDGFFDLLVSSELGGIKLYKNNGEMEFEDITETCGISTDVAKNWGISFADINRDGYVDLQLCRYQDDWFFSAENPSVEPELWTRLYLNNGDETFTDYTIAGGMIIDPSPVFFGVFFDFNNDLWPDNYTIIDRDPGNHLFVNDEGSFTDVTEQYQVSLPFNEFMSNSIADYNNDGYLDVFMTNTGTAQRPTFLLQNNGGESFSNVTQSAGVEFFDFNWGAIWIDSDNDGWQDLFIGNRYDAPHYFFSNDNGTFTDLQSEMGAVNQSPSFSSAKGDFDNDGFYDIVIQSRPPDMPQLIINQQNQNRFIKITPHGTVSNSMATGSWIHLYANGSKYVHYTLCGEGYISQNSQHLIFGLGEEATVVDSLEIWYPSGHADVYYNLPVNTSHDLFEGETYHVTIAADDTLLCQNEQTLLDAGVHATYLWNTGDTTRFISVDASGIYSVSVTNEFGISDSTSVLVQYFPDPFISASISPNACRGDSTATISLENLLSTPTESVIWDNGMTGETIDLLVADDYSYIFTDANNCTVTGTISVVDPAELLIFANSNPEQPNQSDGTIDLTIFGGVSPYVIVLEGDTLDSTISGLNAGVYAISVTDAFGCTAIVEATVESTLGIDRNETSELISVYPNPTRDRVTIESKSKIAHVALYGYTGILKSEALMLEENSVSLENFPAGLYLLQVELTNSEVGYFKIVKK